MKSDRILLSIKPEYVEQIERHTKLFEFRKRNFKKVPSEIWVYASAPLKLIVEKLADRIQLLPKWQEIAATGAKKHLWSDALRITAGKGQLTESLSF